MNENIENILKREATKSPCKKTKKEEVEDELNKTIEALEEVAIFSNTDKTQQLEITTSASLGKKIDQSTVLQRIKRKYKMVPF